MNEKVSVAHKHGAASLTRMDITPLGHDLCAGVLYHMPNPIEFLMALHAITSEHLILTTNVTDTVVENEAGRLEIPSSAAVFIPALREEEKAIISADWAGAVGNRAGGLTRDAHWNPHDFGPWWWLPTIECLKSMCLTTGFTIVDGQRGVNGRSYVLLLSKR